VTICLRNRIPIFGSIRAGSVWLSPAGSIAAQCWKEIPRHHSHVNIDEYVIMPDHVHGILILESKKGDHGAVASRPKQVHDHDVRRGIGPLPTRSVSQVVASYKAAVTRLVRCAVDAGFAWQGRYHDSVIGSRESLAAIRAYIRYNPMRESLKR